MTNIHDIVLQIKDKNVIWEDKAEEVYFKKKKSLFFYATYTYCPDACPNCGCENHDNSIVKNGTRTSRITLNQVSGLPAFLKLRKQRFFCRECSHSFTADTTSIVDRNGFISKNVKNEIKVKACDTVSETHIAKEMNVSVHTVRRVVNETADSLRIKPLNELPEHMCWDEFKSVASAEASMSFAYCDAITHQLVDVVQDRKMENLVRYFNQFPLQTRLNVKTISIDMYAPYIEVIKRLFPKTKIIIDPFHIIQALNRELNKTRTRKMNQVRYKDRRLYNKLKRYWKLILKNRDELQSYNYKYYRLFDWLTHSQGIVDYLLQEVPSLKPEYETVHELREAFKERDFNEFKEELMTVQTKYLSDGLNRVLQTLKKFLPYIQNTCEYPTLSNGPIEGINNKIKVLKRNAYGYSSFTHFRNRILLMSKLFTPTTKKGIKQSDAA